jgi:hypothetical protein
MKNKRFFGMIVCMALAIGLVLTGCPTEDSGGGDGGGSSASSIKGIWVDVRVAPTLAYIFTDVDDAVIPGSKVAYYSTSLTNEGTPASGTEIRISGTAYTYTLSADKSTLTLNGYTTDAQGNPSNVVFERAQGYSGTTVNGIWISRLASGDAKYTMIIVRSGTADVFTSIGSANWGVTAYALSSDANSTYIKWGNAAPAAYTKESDPVALNIPRPTGGVPDNGLIMLANF